MRATTASAALLAAVLLTAGCTGGSEPSDKPAAASSSPTPRTYDVHDCIALLERNYQRDSAYDASGDPECEHLTRDEYTDAVGEVLKDHVGDFFDQGAREVAWDSAWEDTSAAEQKEICEFLDTHGPAYAGWAMRDEVDPEVIPDPTEWMQYIHDNKCDAL